MVLKLAGFPMSTCTQRVRIVLEHLSIPYTFVPVDMSKGEHKSAAFLAHQPFGQVPYIVDDDGTELFESRAIARDLALALGGLGSVLPAQSDRRGTALFERAVSIETTSFDPNATGVVVERFLKPKLFGQPTNEAEAARFVETLESKLAVYEVLLGKTKYLGGDELTLADMFHLPMGSRLPLVGVDFLENTEKFPNVARWWKDVSALPAWVKVQELSTLPA